MHKQKVQSYTLLREATPGRQYLRVFLTALILAAVIYLPFLIIDKGIFVYYGDYNVQQIPFYQMCHDMIRQGEVGWNWYTDLGSNFVGSYAFYLMGSPFFWLTIPFPSGAVPYLMAPLMMLKIATATTTSFGYLRRFVRNPDYAFLGALMYAFSGYSIYNIFFNHFHEVIAFFPLLLIAMEEYFVDGRRGVFPLAVGLLAIVNYYFFFGEVIFCVLYFVVCAFTRKEYKVTVANFFLFALEAVLGLVLSMVLLLPAIMMVLSNPRLDNWLLGWSGLLYGNEQRYGLILSSLFYPPDVPAYPNLFPDSNAKWSSVSLYLPLFSTVGLVAFMKIHGQRFAWIKKLLCISLFIALIPILNSAFSLFNSSYYARWYFMPVLLMAAATSIALEQADTKTLRSGVRWTMAGVLLFAVVAVFPSMEDDQIVFGQLISYPERFAAYFAIVLAAAIIVSFLIRLPKRQFVRPACLSLSLMICATSIIMLSIGKGNATAVHRVVDMGLNAEFETIASERDDVYRVDTYNSNGTRVLDNFPMFWQIPTIQAFQSVVSGSIFTFYDFLGIDRDVASRPDISYVGLRALTSCKYLLNYEEPDKLEIEGFHYVTTENDLDIYENENYIPMGFAYDYYITESEVDSCSDGQLDRLLVKALYLTDEQVEKYGDLLKPLPEGEGAPLTAGALSEAAADRRKQSCDTFVRDKSGFTAVFTSDTPELVFFSVPWDSGWTATVNGQPVEIENVDCGMMAVEVPAGTSKIRFDYETPGLKAGAALTGIGFILWAGYLFLLKRKGIHPAGFDRCDRHSFLNTGDEDIPLSRAYTRTVLRPLTRYSRKKKRE